MQITHIKAHNLPDAWFQCLWRIMDDNAAREYTIQKGSFEGHKRREFDFAMVHITNPEQRPLVPDMPPSMDITPPTSMDYVNEYFANYLMSPEMQENEQYTYGSRICISVDQVIETLKMSPDTNQATIEIATPFDIKLSDPPCLRLIDCRVQDGKLHFVIYFRSWDLWGGFPPNLAGLQLLKEYMAAEIGVEDGEMIASSKGLHLYDFAFEFAKRRVYK